MKKYFVLLLTLICIMHIEVYAQRTSTDKKLTAKVQNLIKNFNGEVGVYVKHLKTGKIVAINADELFPTASTIKIPIMVGVFDKIEKGELEYNKNLKIDKSRELYKGDAGILASLADSSNILLSQALMLSISVSDNSASLWLQQLAGTGTQINSLFNSYGFESTRVNSRTPGREKERDLYGWGQTSPREMATLVEKIRKGEIVSQAASEEMYRVLGNMYLDHRSISQIPPYIKVASKTGSVNKARSEVVLVNAPHGDYVFAIYTKNQKDESWRQNNEGFVLIRNLSALLWNHFEPKYGWQPPENSKYQKLW